MKVSAWVRSHRATRVILVLDMVESVRLIRSDESDVITKWRRFVQAMNTKVLPQHGGRMVKSLGDGMLVEFDQVANAVRAAHTAHEVMAQICARSQARNSIYLRAGIHAAEVVVDEVDVYGAGVNLASRLASLAPPGKTVGSDVVREALLAGVDADIEDLGDCYVKHIEEPIRAYLLSPVGTDRLETLRLLPMLPSAELIRPRVAVLTFHGEGEAALVGKLLADEFAVMVSSVGTIAVMSRLSTRRVAPADDSGNQLETLRALKATYAICGQCLGLQGKIILQVELVHVPSDAVLWSTSIRTSADEAVSRPNEVIGDANAEMMRALMKHETHRAQTNPIESLESYSLLLGGITLMHRQGRGDFLRAKQLLEAVCERVPRHPEPYAWLSKWQVFEVWQGWSADPKRSASLADDYASRALAQDSSCALALTTAGMVDVYFRRNMAEGEQHYLEAIAANPNEPLAWLLKGMLHAFRGEGDAAVHDTSRAQGLSPIDPMSYYFDTLSGCAALAANDFNGALMYSQRAIRSNCLHASTWRTLVVAHVLSGRIEEAKAAVTRLMQVEPTFTVNGFLSKSPSADFDMGKRFAAALREAGVPNG